MAPGQLTGKKPSLAAQIEALFSPAPAAVAGDPEDASGFGEESRRIFEEAAGDGDLYATEKAGPSSGFARAGLKKKGLTLKGPLTIEGEEYGGRPSKRSRVFGEEGLEAELALEGGRPKGRKGASETEDGSEDEEAEEGEEEDSEGGEEEYEEADEEEGDEEAEARMLRLAALRSSDPEAEDFEREFEEYAGGDGARDADGNELEDEGAEKLLEGPAAFSAGALKGDGEVAKAKAVAAQCALWERTLEVRILMQRLMGLGSKLPYAEDRGTLVAHHGAAAQGYQEVSGTLGTLLGAMLDVAEAAREANPARKAPGGAVGEENGEAQRGNGSGRERGGGGGAGESTGLDLDALWERCSAEYSQLKAYADGSLDRWHRKTLLTTGKLSLGSKGTKLQALNQSISMQVQSAMRNPERLIKRTRVPRGAVEGLGQRHRGIVEGGKGRVQEAVEDEGDPESYDDAEFYQQLLQEFLESSGGGDMGALALHRARKLKKKTNNVDRRASKGRKIRYTVMTPLVNFMAPELTPSSTMAERLFLELFGQTA